MGQDRVGPSSKIWASRNNSGLSRINGSSLARAVGVYGRLWDLREPEVPGRANDGATTATDVVLKNLPGFIFCFFREGVVCIFARQALIKLYLSHRKLYLSHR